ncbi:MAG: hypothetical protein U0M51_04250 [Eggerthellaceae bacterium]
MTDEFKTWEECDAAEKRGRVADVAGRGILAALKAAAFIIAALFAAVLGLAFKQNPRK